MKIALIQIVTDEIMDYAMYSTAINKAYCEKHGYTHIVSNPMDSEGRHPSWAKVKIAEHNLDNFDVMFILDSDAIISNHDISITEVLGDSRKPFTFCENGLNGGRHINCGAFIIQDREGDKGVLNTYNVKEFLKLWWKLGEDLNHLGRFWEQDTLNTMYEEQQLYINGDLWSPKDLIEVRPMNAFNSWWQDYTDLDKLGQQFVIHVMANSDQVRKDFFMLAADKLAIKIEG